MGLFAEFEREMIDERVKAGIARARVKGTKSGKAFGRPSAGHVSRGVVIDLLSAQKSVRTVSAETGFSVGSVTAIRAELVKAGTLSARAA